MNYFGRKWLKTNDILCRIDDSIAQNSAQQPQSGNQRPQDSDQRPQDSGQRPKSSNQQPHNSKNGCIASNQKNDRKNKPGPSKISKIPVKISGQQLSNTKNNKNNKINTNNNANSKNDSNNTQTPINAGIDVGKDRNMQKPEKKVKFSPVINTAKSHTLNVIAKHNSATPKNRYVPPIVPSRKRKAAPTNLTQPSLKTKMRKN